MFIEYDLFKNTAIKHLENDHRITRVQIEQEYCGVELRDFCEQASCFPISRLSAKLG